MGTKSKNRKRPCGVCRKWFQPDARLGSRQKTCGSAACQKEWHARTCRKWNKKNRAYFREIYLGGVPETWYIIPTNHQKKHEKIRLDRILGPTTKHIPERCAIDRQHDPGNIDCHHGQGGGYSITRFRQLPNQGILLVCRAESKGR